MTQWTISLVLQTVPKKSRNVQLVVVVEVSEHSQHVGMAKMRLDLDLTTQLVLDLKTKEP